MAFFGRFGNVSRQATNRGIKIGQDLYGHWIGVNLANEKPRAFGAGGVDGLYRNSYVARVGIGYARGYGNSYGAASSDGSNGDAGTTFRKQHKGRIKGIAYRDNNVCFGRYALQALEPSWITSRQLEAGRRVMSRNVRRSGQIWVRIFPDKPVTARPTGARMGSGKGSPKYCVAGVKPGKILYEMGGVEENIARKAISIAASKIPIRTQFIISG